jgi:hypothetical protein
MPDTRIINAPGYKNFISCSKKLIYKGRQCIGNDTEIVPDTYYTSPVRRGSITALI